MALDKGNMVHVIDIDSGQVTIEREPEGVKTSRSRKAISTVQTDSVENLELAVKEQIVFYDVATREILTLAALQDKRKVQVRPNSASMLTVLLEQPLQLLVNIAWVLAYYYPTTRKDLVALASMKNKRISNGMCHHLICRALEKHNLVPQAFWLFLNGVHRRSKTDQAMQDRPGSPHLKECLDEELTWADKPDRPKAAVNKNIAFATVFPANHISVVVVNADHPEHGTSVPHVRVAHDTNAHGPVIGVRSQSVAAVSVCTTQGQELGEFYRNIQEPTMYSQAKHTTFMRLSKSHCGDITYDQARKLATTTPGKALRGLSVV